MTPGARIAAVIALLEEIARGRTPADRALAGYVRTRRYIGAKDRRAIGDTLFAVLRRVVPIDHALAPATPTARLRAARYLAEQGEDPDRIFSGEGHAPAPLAPDERAALAAAQDCPIPDWAAANLPQWLQPRFARRFGDRWREHAEALNRSAPVDLRVNRLKADREAARAALEAAGHAAMPTPWSPDGLRLDARFVPGALAPFTEGWVEPQDEASQLVALLTDARPGMTVVDLCAGAGGKTLALAATMENRGRLVACDSDPRRLARLAPRTARAGVTIVDQIVVKTDGEPLPPPLAGLAGRADRVLVDAPCSGTGTWRRQPDARLRLGEGDLDRLVALQDRLLAQAAELVRPGGRIVYAVCSVLAEEGPECIAATAGRSPALHPIAPSILMEKAGLPPLPGACMADPRGLTLTPLDCGTDGFFIGALERHAG